MLDAIFTAFNVFFLGVFPGIYMVYAGKTGWDVMSSRGTVDAKELPWQRLLIGGGLMCGPAAFMGLMAML